LVLLQRAEIMSQILHLPRRSFLLLAAQPVSLLAQSSSGLYDPQPPANAAYLRVLLPLRMSGHWQLEVDGKPRFSTLVSGEPSPYLVIGSGSHQISVKDSAGKRVVLHEFNALPGRANTWALSATDKRPTVFDDKTSSNKLKAQLSVYHLGKDVQIDVLTPDGQTKVFSQLVPGSISTLAVNPVQVELVANAGGKPVSGRVAFDLVQGASYSLFLMPDAQGKFQLIGAINRVERYTGK
jgi:hypothetical protein